MTGKPGYHDIGGRPGGRIVKAEHPFEPWQKLSEAIRGALETKGGIVSLDEIRRVFETFGEDIYASLGFYERRAEALTQLLDEKGVVSMTEVQAEMDVLAASRGLSVDHRRRTVTSLEDQGSA